MRLSWTTVDGRTAATATCVECGCPFTALTERRPTTVVVHRCATGVAGPVWTLMEAPVAGLRRRRRAAA